MITIPTDVKSIITNKNEKDRIVKEACSVLERLNKNAHLLSLDDKDLIGDYVVKLCETLENLEGYSA